MKILHCKWTNWEVSQISSPLWSTSGLGRGQLKQWVGSQNVQPRHWAAGWGAHVLAPTSVPARDASPAWSQVALQPSHVPRGLCAQPEVVKWVVLKISVENWQLELFSLHFHNFFTWHLLEGEYYWRDIYFLNVYQSMKKFITWEHLLFLRNMDPSTESKCWRWLCKWNHFFPPWGKSF